MSNTTHDSTAKRRAVKSSGTAKWVLFSVVAIVGMFFFLVYHSHLQMNFENEAVTVQDFVSNKLAALPEIPESIIKIEREVEETIAKDTSWIGQGRKEIEDYLLRLNEANKHAFQQHHGPVGSTIDGINIALEKENYIQLKSDTNQTRADDRRGYIAPAANRDAKDRYEKLDCPGGDLVSYWRKTTQQDMDYVTPYSGASGKTRQTLRDKYITFEPDVGGWNNIRMQMEVVIVFAAATGRTLVIPPEQAMYLMDKGKGTQNAHSFEDYFPFDKIRKVLKVISMEEFLRTEGVAGHLTQFNDSYVVLYPPQNSSVVNAMNRPEKRAMWAYLRSVAYCPKWEPFHHYIVFPPAPGVNVSLYKNASIYNATRSKFSSNRKAIYYNSFMQNTPLIHFISLPEQGYRLLTHFYTFLHFEDPFMERFYRRFVRDYVHYVNEIYCYGASIVQDMIKFSGGKYAAFHIRRGELQYKEVKLPAEKILENIKNGIPSDLKVAYIATDERNKSFFDAFHKKFEKVYYLDDFFEQLQLGKVNPNYLGMIDQIACTQGEIFVGTWFSTFTGYITRLRGYLGHPEKSTFFGDKNHRDRYQQYEVPKFPFYMREWREAFMDIDEK